MRPYQPADDRRRDTVETIREMIRQAAVYGEVIFHRIDGIPLFVTAGDEENATLVRYHEATNTRLQMFLQDNAALWRAHQLKFGRQSEIAELDAALARQEAVRRAADAWAKRYLIPNEEGSAPALMDAAKWNAVVESYGRKPPNLRCLVGYAFAMAAVLEGDFKNGTVTWEKFVQADQICDHYGLSGGATITALHLLVDAWPYGQALVDLYTNPRSGGR